MQGVSPSKLKGQLSGFQSGAVPFPLFNPHVCRLNQLKLNLINWDQLSKGKPTVIHRFPMGVSCQCSLQSIDLRYPQSYISSISQGTGHGPVCAGRSQWAWSMPLLPSPPVHTSNSWRPDWPTWPGVPSAVGFRGIQRGWEIHQVTSNAYRHPAHACFNIGLQWVQATRGSVGYVKQNPSRSVT
jgi:hypothetical protein